MKTAPAAHTEEAAQPRLKKSHLPKLIVWAVLGVALLISAADLPSRWVQAEAILPVAQHWAEPDEQYRIQSLPASYDLLKAADGALPREAVVLLVTSGRDVAHEEYIMYHRALYFLAPRPVWWLSPAPSDGSWKSRWWVSTSATPESVSAIASGKGASYVLAHEVGALPIGEKVAEAGDGYVLRLDSDGGAGATRAVPPYPTALWPLQVAAAIAVTLLLGFAVVTATAHLGYRFGLIEAIALSWVLGAGVLSALMLWVNAVGLNLSWEITVVTLLASAVAIWAVKARKRLVAPVESLQDSHYEVHAPNQGRIGWVVAIRFLLVAFFLLQVALAALMAVGRPLQVWDSWVNWGIKSRIIFLEGEITPALYADASHTVTHLDYPLLVPLVQAWLYGWLGAPDDRLVGIISLLFYLALAGVLYGGLQRRGVDDTLALAAAVAVVGTGHIWGLTAIVFAELPLVVFATVAGLYLLEWLQSGSRGALLVAALAAGFMPWTKREGVVLLVALCLGVLLTSLRTRRAWIAIGAFVVAGGLIAGPWYAFVASNGIVNAAFAPINLATLNANLYRVPIIVEIAWNSLLSGGWGYIWPMLAVGGLVTWLLGAKRDRYASVLLVAATLYIIMAAATYIFSAFVPYEQHVISSIDRLLAPVAPMLIGWLAMRSRPDIPSSHSAHA